MLKVEYKIFDLPKFMFMITLEKWLAFDVYSKHSSISDQVLIRRVPGIIAVLNEYAFFF